MNIRNIRKDRGLTQTKLAERIGVLPNAISQWETGRRKPRTSKLKRIAKVLECTIDDLLNDETEQE